MPYPPSLMPYGLPGIGHGSAGSVRPGARPEDKLKPAS